MNKATRKNIANGRQVVTEREKSKLEIQFYSFLLMLWLRIHLRHIVLVWYRTLMLAQNENVYDTEISPAYSMSILRTMESFIFSSRSISACFPFSEIFFLAYQCYHGIRFLVLGLHIPHCYSSHWLTYLREICHFLRLQLVKNLATGLLLASEVCLDYPMVKVRTSVKRKLQRKQGWKLCAKLSTLWMFE